MLSMYKLMKLMKQKQTHTYYPYVRIRIIDLKTKTEKIHIYFCNNSSQSPRTAMTHDITLPTCIKIKHL